MEDDPLAEFLPTHHTVTHRCLNSAKVARRSRQKTYETVSLRDYSSRRGKRPLPRQAGSVRQRGARRKNNPLTTLAHGWRRSIFRRRASSPGLFVAESKAMPKMQANPRRTLRQQRRSAARRSAKSQPKTKVAPKNNGKTWLTSRQRPRQRQTGAEDQGSTGGQQQSEAKAMPKHKATPKT